ncbi:MAG: AgmX/PglI C-terminal domain-containing protein [Archangium sp.]
MNSLRWVVAMASLAAFNAAAQGGTGQWGIGGPDGGAQPPIGKVTEDADRATVQGSLEKAQIRRVIKTHLSMLGSCSTKGKVVIQFVIGPQGAVVQSATRDSTLGDAKADECVVAAVRRWFFPNPSGGGVVSVTWPLQFSLKAEVDAGAPAISEELLLKAMGPPNPDAFSASNLADAARQMANGSMDARRDDVGRSKPQPDPIILGSMPKEVVQRVVGTKDVEVRECALFELKNDGGTPWGKVSVKFVIGPTGSVNSAEVKDTTVNILRMQTCITGIVSRLQFPPPKGGGVVVVTWPFELNAL